MEWKRVAREYSEPLQELRRSAPGMRALFVPLLVVPFNQRFEDVSKLQQYLYFFALACAAVSAALPIVPTARHRLLWPRRERERRLTTANGRAIAGTVCLALSIGAVLLTIANPLPATVRPVSSSTPMIRLPGAVPRPGGVDAGLCTVSKRRRSHERRPRTTAQPGGRPPQSGVPGAEARISRP